MAAPFPSRDTSPRVVPGVGVTQGQIMLDITIGDIVSVGWAHSTGEVTISSLSVICEGL